MDLQKRIEQLERERWLYLALAVLGALAGFAAVGLAVMRSSGKEWVAANGTMRAVLGADKSGRVGLQLYNGQYLRGTLSLDGNGNPQMVVYDAAAKARHQLTFDTFDAVVRMYGTDDKLRVELKAEPNGGAVTLYDTAGKHTRITPAGVAPSAGGAAPTKGTTTPPAGKS